MITWLKQLLQRWRMERMYRKRLKKMRGRDPFIYK
jgi:hypothetical protein